jgi:hypothetical protein
MPDVIGDLRQWFDDNRNMLIDLGLTAEFSPSPPERANRSGVLAIESPRHMGQLQVWETGEAELSVGDIGSGSVTEEHLQITSLADVERAAQLVLARIQQP